ncbi:MAG: aminoacyl-histidine dipeptidase [Defluviitaleaceae bacterium]|nr:aminoacyl-histidine dipeptidase [Defluviitaleaceae bacterium]
MVLANYEPKAVLAHFEAISQIPRGSGNEKAVSDFIAAWAKNLGLKTVQDDWNNLIIYKPATPGNEAKTTVMLQAHLDMVCEKNAGVEFDFLNDPLDLYVDGDLIRARGTTLGGDNGIGVALAMAVLEATGISHPAIEVVLTVDEEAGMTGAKNIDASLLSAGKMINLDSGHENYFTMGCASGTTAEFFLPASWETATAQGYKLNVKGLKGGHSGIDITDDRGNAIRIMAQVLSNLKEAGVKIASIQGGMKVNAIPREAEAVITLDAAPDAILEKYRETLKQQFRAGDPGIQLTWEKATPEKTMSATNTNNLISSLLLLPLGVISMSLEIEGLPNASSNIGVIETRPDGVMVYIMPRGAAGLYNAQTEAVIKAVAGFVGANVSFSSRSPAWPYNPDSPMLKVAIEAYKNVFNRDPQVTATHGGLECGIFVDMLPGLDAIAFGPDTHDVHTPDESMSISSVGRVWVWLQKLLGEL